MVSLIAYMIGAIYSNFLFVYGLLNASGYFSPFTFLLYNCDYVNLLIIKNHSHVLAYESRHKND